MTGPDAAALRPELVDRARAGDDEALRTLLRAAYPLIRRWAVARLGDPDDADDVTQVVLVRLVRSLPAYRSDARFTTWLYRMVQNAAVDRARTMGRRADREADLAAAGAVAAPVADPGEAADRELLLARVREAFLELPPRQRQVFDLADLQGRGGPEIAEMLGVSQSTVRVSLRNARRAIRARILATHPELVEEMSP